MKKFINVWDNKHTVFVSRKTGIEEIDLDWYFCISKEEAEKHRDKLKKMVHNGIIGRLTVDGNYVRVYVDFRSRHSAIDTLKGMGLVLYESDVRPYQRYLADADEELETDQTVLYFDIESDDRGQGIDPGSARLLSIAGINDKGEEFFEVIKEDTDAEEKRVLKWFMKLIEKHDILEGWYSEGYDLVAIKRRCELHGIRFDCQVLDESNQDLGGLHSVRKSGKYKAKMNSINHIDLMQKMKEMHYRDTELIKKVRSFSLSAVSKVMLNDDKVDLGGKSIYYLWEKEPEKLKEYNMHDVQLLKKLDDKIQITRQKLVEHHILSARINDFTSSKKIDAYALRQARVMGKRLFSNNKSSFDKKLEVQVAGDDELKPEDDKYAGGYVFEPIRGLYNNLTVFDFQSLYPSIIRTFNISPDALAQPHEPGVITIPTGAAFSPLKGVVPRILESVLNERNRVRHDEMPKYKKGSFEYENAHYKQYSLKVIANSMYGVMGAEFSRFYRRECAEGITLTGQYLLKLMYNWMKDAGHTPVYGDTDSLFVLLKNDADPKVVGTEVNKYLEAHIKDSFGINENHMSFDYEATYDKFLMQDKKKYVGTKDGKITKMMGMEAKKRDTLPMTERAHKELLAMLLTEDHDEEFYRNWVIGLMKMILYNKVPKDDLIFQKRLNKEVEAYAAGSQDLVHVTVARELKAKYSKRSAQTKINLYSMGAYIPWIVTNGEAKIIGVHPDDYVQGKHDKIYYWTQAIYPALKRTLSAVFPQTNWDSYDMKWPRKNRKLREKVSPLDVL